MSSIYRPICVSHDPAIVVETEWSSAHRLEGALANRRDVAELQAHQHCDLLGGRYSYPLFEVYDPSTRTWIGTEWLRLAYECGRHLEHQPDNAGRLVLALGSLPRSWSWPTLQRLAGELGIEQP